MFCPSVQQPAVRALLATCSVLALLATTGTSAEAQVVTNPATPFTNTGTINGILLNDTKVHSGNIVNTGTVTPAGAATPAAIQLVNTNTLLGTIINSGTISSSTGTPNAAGIAAVNVSVSNGIVNSDTGMIAVSGTLGATGIAAASTVFAGGISNAGSLRVTGSTAIGIVAGSQGRGTLSQSFGGGIFNSGNLSVTSNGAGETASGISASNSTFTGNINNSGTIFVTSTQVGPFIRRASLPSRGSSPNNSTTIFINNFSGLAVGIRVGVNPFFGATPVSTFQGSILNTAVITASGAATGTGAKVDALTFIGGITNAGTISGSGRGHTGIGINAQVSSFTGDIVNSGSIGAVGDTRGVGIALSGPVGSLFFFGSPSPTVHGNLANTGTIAVTSTFAGFGLSSTAIGISLSSATVSGNVANTGTIAVTSGGRARAIGASGGNLLFGTTDTSIGGSISNGGVVAVSGRSTASAIEVSGTTIGGSVVNTGTLSAVASFATTGVAAAVGLQINGSVGGTISNSGLVVATIESSTAFPHAVDIRAGGTIGGDIVNAGTLSAAVSSAFFNGTALGIDLSTALTGAINNSGSIRAVSVGTISNTTLAADAISVSASVINRGIINTGLLAASATDAAAAVRHVTVAGINISGSNLSGGILNDGTISVAAASGGAVAKITGIQVDAFGAQGNLIDGTRTFAANTVGGGITNRGLIVVTANASTARSLTPFGVFAVAGAGGFPTAAMLASGATIAGGLTNAGTIIDLATNSGGVAAPAGIDVQANGGGNQGGGTALAHSTSTGGLITGAIVNTGSMLVSSTGIGNGSILDAADGILVVFVSPQAIPGVATPPATVASNIVNSGLISVLTTGSGQGALGIQVGNTTGHVAAVGVFSGSISNAGTIIAGADAGVLAAGIEVVTPVMGGITNTGSIIGSTAAIDLSQEAGGSTVITQAGGLIQGAVKLSGNADQFIFSGGTLNGQVIALAGNHAVVSVPSGNPTLTPTAGVSSVSSFTQTGGTLTMQLTANTAPGAFPTVSAGAIKLNGALLASLQGNLAGFANATFRDVFVSGMPVINNETVSISSSLFNASLVPDATTANALDLEVVVLPSLGPQEVQTLAQSLRFGLVDQQAIVDTIENRLQVGESGGGPRLAFASARGDRLALSDADQQAQVPVSGSGMGFSMWGRVYGGVGSAPATGTLPGFRDDRIGGIVGADWRFSPFVLGGGFHYAHTEAPFDDGSHTKLDTYQGLVYGGWRNGPAYVTALASGGANDYSINRNMMPFGLAGFATSSPSGTLFTAFGEGGYAFGWEGATLTPYVNLDYAHQHVGAFTETGGFGALAVSAANGNSLQTTIGIRASTTIDLGGSTLVPEVRAGWAHEFLDASQTLTAQLAGTAASPFTVVGTQFGRDSAVVGVGVSHEFAPGASVFVDYDGKFTGGFDQHAGSVGVRVRF